MKKLKIIVGAYGSGKSEYAINEAYKSHLTGLETVLVDLDVVNPYFRSRDVKEQFEEKGISVISPEGEFRYADLPMLSKSIYKSLADENNSVIFDVGGDPSGCRVLGRYTELIKKFNYKMEFVVNTYRPFTNTRESIIDMLKMIQTTSKLKITELICNSNLMEHTDTGNVTQGIKIIDTVAESLDIPFTRYLVMDCYNCIIPDGIEGKKKDVITHFLKKPWEIPGIKGI